MSRRFRELLRASVFLRRWLSARRHRAASITVPDGLFDHVIKLSVMLEKATRRGWLLAAAQLRYRLQREVERATERLHVLKYELEEHCEKPLPTESELCRELLALGQEFEEVVIDVEGSQLSVTTESVVLDGIDLGRFRIQLDCVRVDVPAYRVIALDSNPAAINSSVTHPHVQDQQLCEGDGRAAIRNSLASGRLTDFFLIVNQILSQYARGSAFVELSQWEGIPCRDCGDVLNEDDRYFCERCGETICTDCSRCCKHCDVTTCAECMNACPICDDPSCDSCLTACKVCGAQVCPGCIEEGVCTNCFEENQDECEEEEEPVGAQATVPEGTRQAAAGTTVQPDRLGEAALSA